MFGLRVKSGHRTFLSGANFFQLLKIKFCFKFKKFFFVIPFCIAAVQLLFVLLFSGVSAAGGSTSLMFLPVATILYFVLVLIGRGARRFYDRKRGRANA